MLSSGNGRLARNPQAAEVHRTTNLEEYFRALGARNRARVGGTVYSLYRGWRFTTGAIYVLQVAAEYFITELNEDVNL